MTESVSPAESNTKPPARDMEPVDGAIEVLEEASKLIENRSKTDHNLVAALIQSAQALALIDIARSLRKFDRLLNPPEK